MKPRQLVMTLFWALGLGFLTALPLGARQRISIEIWFIMLTLWVLGSLVLSLMRTAPLSSTSHVDLRPWLPDRWRRAPAERESELRDHRAIEGLLIRARDNERSHSRQLRPRLEALTDYYLPIRFGIDPVNDPGGRARVLGDLEWIVDPTIDDRCPTFEDMDRFLDLAVGSTEQRQPVHVVDEKGFEVP